MTTLEEMDEYLRNQPENLTPPEPPEPLEEIPQYRFKTEQEFIEEFGNNWFDDLDNGVDWPRGREGMDYLFGEIFEPEIAETFHKYPSAEIRIDMWNIERGMITDKPLK
jgi:hypothetical protein